MQYKYWDLGEVTPVRPSKNALASILDAIIRLHGKIHDTHSLELDNNGGWKYKTVSCSVLFRISLPIGSEVKFVELTGYELSEPPKISI